SAAFSKVAPSSCGANAGTCSSTAPRRSKPTPKRSRARRLRARIPHSPPRSATRTRRTDPPELPRVVHGQVAGIDIFSARYTASSRDRKRAAALYAVREVERGSQTARPERVAVVLELLQRVHRERARAREPQLVARLLE